MFKSGNGWNIKSQLFAHPRWDVLIYLCEWALLAHFHSNCRRWVSGMFIQTGVRELNLSSCPNIIRLDSLISSKVQKWQQLDLPAGLPDWQGLTRQERWKGVSALSFFFANLTKHLTMLEPQTLTVNELYIAQRSLLCGFWWYPIDKSTSSQTLKIILLDPLSKLWANLLLALFFLIWFPKQTLFKELTAAYKVKQDEKLTRLVVIAFIHKASFQFLKYNHAFFLVIHIFPSLDKYVVSCNIQKKSRSLHDDFGESRSRISLNPKSF